MVKWLLNYKHFQQSERLPKSRVFNTHWRSKNSLFTTQISPANENHAKVTVLLAYHFKLLEPISLGILHRLCCVYFFVSKKSPEGSFFFCFTTGTVSNWPIFGHEGQSFKVQWLHPEIHHLWAKGKISLKLNVM